MERNNQCKCLNVSMDQGWVDHGSARAVLWVLPSARALHSTGSGAGARAAETQLRARAGCRAVTGLPWLPRVGPPLP